MTKIPVEDQGLADQIRSYLEANGTEVPLDMPIAISLPGSTKAPQKCESGSGQMTRGGKFAPGFDAKLKSALFAIVRGEPSKIPVELQENGPMYRPVSEWTIPLAEQALDHYGWGRPQPKAVKVPKEPKPETSEDGEKKPSRRRAANKDKTEEVAAESAEATV